MEKSTIDKHVGSRLSALRNDLKIDIEQLAQMLGIAADQLRLYEAGIERVCATELQRIAKVLQVDAIYFFSGLKKTAEDFSAGTSDTQTVPVEEALELMRAFGGIRDPMARKQLIDLAHSFATGPISESAH